MCSACCCAQSAVDVMGVGKIQVLSGLWRGGRKDTVDVTQWAPSPALVGSGKLANPHITSPSSNQEAGEDVMRR